MISHEWSPPYVAGVYFALATGLVVLLWLARRFARSVTARRWPFLCLRGAVLALLVFVLLNRVQVAETRQPPRSPEVAYVVDCSRSMALDRPTSRLNLVKRLVSLPRPEGGPNISVYRFGDQLRACQDISELQPVEDSSRLQDALEQLPGRFRQGLPAGVVLFSDGRATDSPSLAETVAGYRKLGLPIHVFPVGSTQFSGDVAVEDVIAPRDAPVGGRLPVRVVVRCRGYAGRRAEVRIRNLSEPMQPALATVPLTLIEGQQACELRIDQGPASGRLVAEVGPLEGEAILENNRVPFQIGARRSKIRVLYMEGTVNGEYRWIRDALVEDPNIECVALEVNNQYAQNPQLYRIGDPSRGYPTTREELFTFDVVICSDINRTAFSQPQLDWTVELVQKRGGGFVMIGGHTSFSAGFWNSTAWDGLIPVDMTRPARDPQGNEFFTGEFRVRIPPGVEAHPIWRIVDDPVKNRLILRRMPPFLGTNLINQLKPGATCLATTDGLLPYINRVMPVMACESYGKGRTFAMAPDSTIDWGRYFESQWGEGDNRYFRKFWRNVIHWLAENSAGANRRLRIETDKVIYRPGQPIQVMARAFDEKLEETDRYRVAVRLRPDAVPGADEPAPIQDMNLMPKNGHYTGALTTPPLSQVPVSARNPLAQLRLAMLEVIAYDGEKVAARTSMEIQVLDDPVEFHDPRPDPACLEELAQGTGGKVLREPEDLSALLSTFRSSAGDVVVSRSPSWDHAGLWLLLVTLLTLDWTLRRLWGLT